MDEFQNKTSFLCGIFLLIQMKYFVTSYFSKFWFPVKIIMWICHYVRFIWICMPWGRAQSIVMHLFICLKPQQPTKGDGAGALKAKYLRETSTPHAFVVLSSRKFEKFIRNPFQCPPAVSVPFWLWTQMGVFVFGSNEKCVESEMSFILNCSEAETIRDSR